MKRLLALAALALCVAIPAQAGVPFFKEYTLVAGNIDSTARRTPWIPIFGASKVVVRTYSGMAAWSTTSNDSSFVDSLTVFSAFLSDSAGGILTGPDGSYTIGADSLAVPITAVGDTASKGFMLYPLPVNKQLRAPANGSGLYSWAYPWGGPTDALVRGNDANATFETRFLRFTIQPLRRSVGAGLMTSPNRANGIKNLKIIARVYYHHNPD